MYIIFVSKIALNRGKFIQQSVRHTLNSTKRKRKAVCMKREEVFHLVRPVPSKFFPPR